MPRCKICKKGNSIGNGGLKCCCSLKVEVAELKLILKQAAEYFTEISTDNYYRDLTNEIINEMEEASK